MPGGRKCDTEIAKHILKLPGKFMDLSVLLDKKKFRSFDNKEGALRGFKKLEDDELGRTSIKQGRNGSSSRVSNTHVSSIKPFGFTSTLYM